MGCVLPDVAALKACVDPALHNGYIPLHLWWYDMVSPAKVEGFELGETYGAEVDVAVGGEVVGQPTEGCWFDVFLLFVAESTHLLFFIV